MATNLNLDNPFGSWIGVTTPKVPDVFKDVRPVVDGIFNTVNIFLEFLNGVLEFVKGFIIDFTNPLLVLINQIIQTLKNLLTDFTQLGVYFTSDWNVIKNMDEMKDIWKLGGGYTGYQTRMVNRLTNQADPTRPDITENTKVFAFFLYTGVEISALLNVIAQINNFIKLFTGILNDPVLPVPINLKAELQKKIFAPVPLYLPVTNANLKVPDAIKFSWTLDAPSKQDSFFPSYVTPPKAFILNVASTSKRLKVGVNSEIINATPTKDLVKERTNQTLTDTKNRLFSTNTEPSNFKTLAYKDAKSWIDAGGTLPIEFYFFFQDNMELFLADPVAKKLYASYYYNSSTLGSFLGGNEFNLTIDLDKLPKKIKTSETKKLQIGEQTYQIVDTATYTNPEELFFEIISIDKEFSGLSDGDPITNANLFEISPPKNPNIKIISDPSLGKPSETASIKIPTITSVNYYTALKNALAIYILGGHFFNTDKTPNKTFSLSSDQINTLYYYLNLDPKDTDFLDYSKNAEDFREDVYAFIISAIRKIPTPTDTILSAYKDSIQFLSQPHINSPLIKGEKIQVFDLLSKEDLAGINPSRDNIGNFGEYSSQKLRNRSLYPSKQQVKNYETIMLYSDYSDITIDEETQLHSIKTVKPFSDVVSEELLTHVKNVLGAVPVKIVSDEGEWINYKLFQAGLPDFTEFLEETVKFLESLVTGITGIIEAIKKFITLLQTRINEIQRIIAKIKAIIDAILNFNTGLGADFFGLLLKSNGTNGLVQDFVNSTNKPSSGSLGVGVGIVIPAMPVLLEELLVALLGG